MKKIKLLSMLLVIEALPIGAMDVEFAEIEKHLIAQEVESRGKNSLLDAIRLQPESEWFFDQDRQVRCKRKVFFLTIQKELYKNQREQDPLAMKVFKSIEEVEAKGGYSPKQSSKKGEDAIIYTRTNRLGHYTSYFWIKQGKVIKKNVKEVDGEAVSVEFKCYRKEPLIRFIEAYNK